MRQMKFRAFHERWGWAKPEDITVYGDGTYYVDYRGENGDKIETYDEKCKELHVDEFTGLQDKNGRDIFENDILESWARDVRLRGVMSWDPHKDCFGFYADIDDEAFPDHTILRTPPEVIGNAHQNRELLK